MHARLNTARPLPHASSELNAAADGFHQDAFFYYFTGLENSVGAVLAIDGKANESCLFLPSHPPFRRKENFYASMWAANGTTTKAT
jgi:hypothetical protein